MLRLLLADDHDIVRRGMKELLEEHAGWTVCAEAADRPRGCRARVEHRPHVAILDLSMPELNGLEATRRIKQALPETEILVFTMHESEELIRDVLAAGARGYLLKSDASRQLSRSRDPGQASAVFHPAGFRRSCWRLPQGRRRGHCRRSDA